MEVDSDCIRSTLGLPTDSLHDQVFFFKHDDYIIYRSKKIMINL